MSLNSFIPVIWAGIAMRQLQKKLVYADGMNRDYEGLIRTGGDTVKVNMIGDVAIGTYVKGSNITWQDWDSAQATMVIDQSKYFAFPLDDVDRTQSNVDLMVEAMNMATYAMANTIDSDLATVLKDGVASANQLNAGSAITDVATTGYAYNYLVDLKVILDENNVPDDGRRWVVVPPWYHGYLLKDARFVSSGSTQAEARLQNGVIGYVLGLTVKISNNAPTDGSDDYYVIAGHPVAASFAEQLTNVEAFRLENQFAEGVRGLWLYGRKVFRPAALAMGRFDKP